MTTKEIIAAYEQGARANHQNQHRQGNLIHLTAPGEVIMTGDLHGNELNFEKLIRLAQLGQEEDVLNCKTIWLCATCYQCGTRCPKGIDFSKIAEALRYLAMGKEMEICGPNHVPADIVAEAAQQALVSTFRKHGL